MDDHDTQDMQGAMTSARGFAKIEPTSDSGGGKYCLFYILGSVKPIF